MGVSAPGGCLLLGGCLVPGRGVSAPGGLQCYNVTSATDNVKVYKCCFTMNGCCIVSRVNLPAPSTSRTAIDTYVLLNNNTAAFSCLWFWFFFRNMLPILTSS